VPDEQQSPTTGSGDIPDPPEPRRTPSTDDPLRRSRTSMLWVATVGFGLVLLVLIILVLQNTQKVEFTFLWWEGTPPLAAALLIAAAGGIAITAIAGSLRILQLRRRVKRG
jgi:uncharacterized integral membrane protein